MLKTSISFNDTAIDEIFKKKVFWFAKYLREYKCEIRSVKFWQYCANIYLGTDKKSNEYISIYYKPTKRRYKLKIARVYDEDFAKKIDLLWNYGTKNYGKYIIPIF